MGNKKVCIIGLGYIGLPTAALLANKGYDVIGVDVNFSVVETINQGKVHIVEPELDDYVKSAISKGNFKAHLEAMPSDIYIICVPTPFHEGKNIPQPNIDFVMSAARSILHLLKDDDLLILESTSPVGTTRKIGEAIKDSGFDIKKIHIAYCPERVLPGKIIRELIENDRIVGGLTPKATKFASDFYKSFVQGDVFETDAATAEMCKLTENSFRDVNIAFANEISLICYKEGINVWDLIKLANRHPRVNVLQPGIGVGGHCIAVDPWFIVAKDPGNAKLIHKAREVNNYKTEWVLSQIKIEVNRLIDKTGKPPKIICLGLAFKPNIDDLRESPAINIANNLLLDGFDVSVVEPNILRHDKFKVITLESALNMDGIFVALVKHQEFLSLTTIKKLSKLQTLDFCGLFSTINS
jgi:UDP-N-acetyl-D-mannosaminuronic acid dehydrogenase